MRRLERELGKRVVFVGQAPSREWPRDRFAEHAGRCSRRVARLLGMTFEELRDHCGWVNLLPRWPGKRGKGDDFDAPRARREAMKLRLALQQKRGPTTVFLLGGAVVLAFGMSGDYFCGAIEHAVGKPELMFIFFPHPSGASHFWNDPRNVDEARLVLGRWAL